jgi:hypothetical protein
MKKLVNYMIYSLPILPLSLMLNWGTTNLTLLVRLFLTGVSLYGVADLGALVKETHKFESRYIDNLVAPYTEETQKIYDERSPINHIDKLNCAMAFFQGDEDKVCHHYSFQGNTIEWICSFSLKQKELLKIYSQIKQNI